MVAKGNHTVAKRLMYLGLGYLSLARTVRNRTTSVLYVADGNSVRLVDHDTQILSEADGSLRWTQKQGLTAVTGASGR